MAGRFIAFALGAAGVLSAAEVTINVFGLFRSATLIVRGAGRTLTVTEPISFGEHGEWTIEVPGRITRRFTGKLAIAKRGDTLEPAITMDLETAVASAVAAEMPADAPAEALRAAAVLARSFYAGSERSQFCDTTHCQHLREPSPAALMAAKATAGTILTYRGRPFAALYSASCGGSSRRAEDVGLASEPYPYFSVQCERCERDEKPWRKTVPLLLAADLLRDRSEQARLKVVRVLGWSAVPGNNYRASRQGEMVLFTGRGQGHGVGLCQRGAIGMAKRGASMREILRHYLPDTTLQ